MKKFLIVILTISSLVFGQNAMAEDDWKPPQPTEMWSESHQYVLITDMSLRHTSEMWWAPKDGGLESICDKPGPGLDCGTGTKGRIYGKVILPHCGSVIESCIEKLWVYREGEPATEAQFKRTSQSIAFEGDPKLQMPSGSGVSIFTSNFQHTGSGGLFAVAPRVDLNIENGQVRIDKLQVDIAGVVETSKSGALDHTIETDCKGGWAGKKKNCSSYGGSFEGNDRCFYIEKGLCALPQRLPEDIRIGVQLKLSSKVAGWFSGRLQNPNIEVSKINSNYNVVKVDARPVNTTRFYAETDTKKGDPDINTLLKPGDFFGKDALFTDFYATNEYAPKVIGLLRDKVKDTAAGVSSLWNFYTTGQAANGRNNCLADNSRVAGIVTTNAMAYLGTAPEFSNGFLQYKVAGLHFMPDGKTPVEGTYDLVMRSEVARCLYGFSNAPISATIEVTGGENLQVATTTVKESDGWLKLSAYGFGFSSKTIKAKVSQKKVKGTITCAKGNLTKRVTAISPKCPPGYKVKY